VSAIAMRQQQPVGALRRMTKSSLCNSMTVARRQLNVQHTLSACCAFLSLNLCGLLVTCRPVFDCPADAGLANDTTVASSGGAGAAAVTAAAGHSTQQLHTAWRSAAVSELSASQGLPAGLTHVRAPGARCLGVLQQHSRALCVRVSSVRCTVAREKAPVALRAVCVSFCCFGRRPHAE
jgi:hypothetical protein